LHPDNQDIQLVTKDALFVLHIFLLLTVDALAAKQN
jgi:hypothetical protein